MIPLTRLVRGFRWLRLLLNLLILRLRLGIILLHGDLLNRFGLVRLRSSLDGFKVEEVIEQREVLRDLGSASKRRELLRGIDHPRGLVLENLGLVMIVA